MSIYLLPVYLDSIDILATSFGPSFRHSNVARTVELMRLTAECWLECELSRVVMNWELFRCVVDDDNDADEADEQDQATEVREH